MSVVAMKKVRLLAHRNDAVALLEIAQESGIFEFHAINSDDAGHFSENAISSDSNTATNHTLTRVSSAVNFLNNYEPEIGLLNKLKHGTTISLTETEIKDRTKDGEAKLDTVLSEVESLHEKLTTLNEERRSAAETRSVFAKWQKLDIRPDTLTTKHTKTFLVQIKDPSSNKKLKAGVTLKEQLEEVLKTSDLKDFHIEAADTTLASVTVLRSGNDTIKAETLKQIGAELVQLPAGALTLSEEIKGLDKKIAQCSLDIDRIENKAKAAAVEYLSTLKIAHDIYTWKKERQETLKIAKTTKRVAVFEGWSEAEELENFKNNLKKAELPAEVVEVTPQKDEVPPVELKNNSLIQPFEIITRLYGLPTHKDIDPTPFLAGFFFLFFGLSLTDVGYGLFLMAVALLVVFYFKVSATVKLFGKLLFLMGLSSALVGVVFGGYLGIDASKLPDLLQKLQQFDPIGNPLPVFYMALGLGVVQVMFGMLLKIYSDSKNNRLVDGVLDQGPWLLLFASLIAYGAASLGYLGAFTAEAILPLIYISLIAVVVASGRAGKTIFEKIQKSLLSLYDSIGYFSDILSYSRLLALGLATSALAFAVNLIADIVRDIVPYVGAVLAILILVVGHLFTLVVNTLGAFIHSARLQFVEFFGKFISGTGRTFKPLKRKESYVTIVKDSG